MLETRQLISFIPIEGLGTPVSINTQNIEGASVFMYKLPEGRIKELTKQYESFITTEVISSINPSILPRAVIIKLPNVSAKIALSGEDLSPSLIQEEDRPKYVEGIYGFTYIEGGKQRVIEYSNYSNNWEEEGKEKIAQLYSFFPQYNWEAINSYLYNVTGGLDLIHTVQSVLKQWNVSKTEGKLSLDEHISDRLGFLTPEIISIIVTLTSGTWRDDISKLKNGSNLLPSGMPENIAGLLPASSNLSPKLLLTEFKDRINESYEERVALIDRIFYDQVTNIEGSEEIILQVQQSMPSNDVVFALPYEYALKLLSIVALQNEQLKRGLIKTEDVLSNRDLAELFDQVSDKSTAQALKSLPMELKDTRARSLIEASYKMPRNSFDKLARRKDKSLVDLNEALTVLVTKGIAVRIKDLMDIYSCSDRTIGVRLSKLFPPDEVINWLNLKKQGRKVLSIEEARSLFKSEQKEEELDRNPKRSSHKSIILLKHIESKKIESDTEISRVKKHKYELQNGLGFDSPEEIVAYLMLRNKLKREVRTQIQFGEGKKGNKRSVDFEVLLSNGLRAFIEYHPPKLELLRSGAYRDAKRIFPNNVEAQKEFTSKIQEDLFKKYYLERLEALSGEFGEFYFFVCGSPKDFAECLASILKMEGINDASEEDLEKMFLVNLKAARNNRRK